MITEVVKVDEFSPETDIIGRAAAVLREGGLVAFPTETVYGLGADALCSDAACRIYEAKGRPSDNPLIVHIADWEALSYLAEEIPPQAKALADAYWPGPLTMIFNKSNAVPDETTGGLSTVAVRMPSHPVALALIRSAGGYIAAPSANASGRPSPTLAQHVATDLDGKIPLILDGGAVGIGIESTIIDVSGISRDANGAWKSDELPMILRPGFITHAMLADVLGEVAEDPGFSLSADVRPKAPGMKYKHYAPKAELVLVSGEETDVVAVINERTEACQKSGQKVGVICTTQTQTLYRADVVKCIGSRSDEAEIARRLYAFLREFDEDGVDCIFSESFSALSIGAAIMNRLLKAAGYQVIEAGRKTACDL